MSGEVPGIGIFHGGGYSKAMRIGGPRTPIVAGGMARKERRAQALAERRQAKKTRGAAGPDLYTWMAERLPAGGGGVLADGAFGGEPVDAGTCWLLDLRDARLAAVEKLKAMGLRTEDEKRLAVVTLIYRLADRVLRVGGTLQVVERMSEAFGEALATGMVRLQRAQAKGTGLGFVALDARPEL